MKTSTEIDQIAAALLTAQQSITFATKDANNPHFRTKYADLPSVIAAVKPALNNAGIAFLQCPSPSEDGRLHLTTRLLHASGQWMEDTAVCPLPKADPQGFGSACTYLRRYSLAAMCGVYQDDDDGNGASLPPSPTKRTTPLTPNGHTPGPTNGHTPGQTSPTNAAQPLQIMPQQPARHPLDDAFESLPQARINAFLAARDMIAHGQTYHDLSPDNVRRVQKHIDSFIKAGNLRAAATA